MEMQPPIELEIQDLSRGGAGVARDASGRVIFVPFTAPGDRVRVRVAQAKKQNYANAELLEVVRPAELRQQPVCPVFGQCGGCQWQHLPYSLQWKTKAGGVLHALKRVGVELRDEQSWGEFPAEQIWEYRNRIQLRGFRETLGFYAASSHSLIPITRCEIARSEINAVLEQTRSEAKKFSEPFKVEITVLPDGKIRKTWNQGHGAAGFRQIHDAQNNKLQEWVRAAISPGKPLLDLFGGSGNLSQALAASAPVVHCIDLGAPRIRPEGSAQNIHFHHAGVLPWLRKAARDSRLRSMAPWAAISDPPRDGLAGEFREIHAALAEIGANELVAVGCDPDNWARDISRFLKSGWSLQRIAVFDFFPQTPHVESAALLKFD